MTGPMPAAAPGVPGGAPLAGDQRRVHWDGAYAGHAAEELSWFQARAEMSLSLIGHTAATAGTSIIDVGGGASLLVDALIDAGFQRLTVLDVSEVALSVARRRLLSRAAQVECQRQRNRE